MIARLLARTRVPLTIVGVALILISTAWGLIDDDAPAALILVALPFGLVLIAVGFVATVWAPTAGGEPATLASPVTGPWLAVNSPTTKVPSHGTHGLGQAFAVDLLYAGEGSDDRPSAGFTAPEEYPSFGRPILSPADGTVVRVTRTARDHLSRASGSALAYFYVESAIREIFGPRAMLGNHIVIRLADGSHMVLAHLRRGSITVERGERVATGQPLAECGNSGNSTEPHLHIQRQDLSRPTFALGLPWTIEPGGIPADGETTSA
ncbi:M23 family metallopeptidase [Agromyces atrinae]|uniref:M23 family metallopeptidase n=1 Tax=Agromyces atrinae TaxID=592376 RepID=A0A4Q2MFV6_9MICO|nr:M23 family metallopeptidase [Agromyces atrinae]NYD67752.1 hypothetical protein [Agromyces atrinae]RXZ88060.1 M23 family metallopeptidase [Agromyces atrinae]